MAKLLSTIIDGFLASKNFISGALGSGWKIWKTNGRYKFEVDDVVVRNTMTVFELLISKIRSVKGALGITQASGKIKSVREDSEKYYIQIEDEMSFVAHDIVKCQTFSSGQKNYWVIVDSIKTEKVGTETVSEIVILKSEFEGASIPEAGDEIVQFGNTTDVRRQSAIYLHADENGVPAVDVLFEITGKSFDGCTKVRLGGALPGEAEQFNGLYCENGLLKGLNENGDEVYKLRPDGSGFVAKGNISWKADGSGSIFNKAIYWDTDGFHFGSGIKLTWDNLDDSAKENLKGEPGIQGEPGKDTNLLPWVEEWDNANKTLIDGESVISPKMFSGTKNAEGKLTGVAFGRGVVTVLEDGVEKRKTGIFGIKDGKVTFSIDEEGNSFYGGEINVKDKFRVNTAGKVFAIDADLEGIIRALAGGKIGPLDITLDGLSYNEGVGTELSISKKGIKAMGSGENKTALIEAILYYTGTGIKAAIKGWGNRNWNGGYPNSYGALVEGGLKFDFMCPSYKVMTSTGYAFISGESMVSLIITEFTTHQYVYLKRYGFRSEQVLIIYNNNKSNGCDTYIQEEDSSGNKTHLTRLDVVGRCAWVMFCSRLGKWIIINNHFMGT